MKGAQPSPTQSRGCRIRIDAIVEITYATQVVYGLSYDEAHVRASTNPGNDATILHKNKALVHLELVLRR
ncbi:MAG: hypothetical protein ACKPKO_40615, partial [Candidatus Fonsibacter sp.]